MLRRAMSAGLRGVCRWWAMRGFAADATGEENAGVVPCAFFKGQTNPPLKPKEEYPAFLWKLLEKQPTLKELTTKYLELGEEALTEEEAIRLSRLGRKKAIRDRKKLKIKL